MRSQREKPLWFLILRAVIVTALVLSLLTLLQKQGILVKEQDLPAQTVEETLAQDTAEQLK